MGACGSPAASPRNSRQSGDVDRGGLGGPGGGPAVQTAGRQLAHVGAIGPHRVDPVGSAESRGECDSGSIRGPSGQNVRRIVIRQLTHVRPIGQYCVDLKIAIVAGTSPSHLTIRSSCAKHLGGVAAAEAERASAGGRTYRHHPARDRGRASPRRCRRSGRPSCHAPRERRTGRARPRRC